MKTILNVRGHRVILEAEPVAVHIHVNDDLRRLFTQDADAATGDLIEAVKKFYADHFHKEFDVSNDSMAVEIWAHLFAERFSVAVRTLNLFQWLDHLAGLAIERSEVIDIGIPGHDNNRFIWDGLRWFRSALAACFLPR